MCLHVRLDNWKAKLVWLPDCLKQLIYIEENELWLKLWCNKVVVFQDRLRLEAYTRRSITCYASLHLYIAFWVTKLNHVLFPFKHSNDSCTNSTSREITLFEVCALLWSICQCFSLKQHTQSISTDMNLYHLAFDAYSVNNDIKNK